MDETEVDKLITNLKVDYAHVLVDEIIKGPDTNRMLVGYGKLVEIDAIFKRLGVQTVITVSHEPLPTPSTEPST